MAGIGYSYNLEELGQAMMIPGLNLSAERAEAAVRAYEEFMDLAGLSPCSSSKGWTGLLNNSYVTIATAAATGSGNSTYWKDKTRPTRSSPTCRTR